MQDNNDTSTALAATPTLDNNRKDSSSKSDRKLSKQDKKEKVSKGNSNNHKSERKEKKGNGSNKKDKNHKDKKNNSSGDSRTNTDTDDGKYKSSTKAGHDVSDREGYGSATGLDIPPQRLYSTQIDKKFVLNPHLLNRQASSPNEFASLSLQSNDTQFGHKSGESTLTTLSGTSTNTNNQFHLSLSNNCLPEFDHGSNCNSGLHFSHSSSQLQSSSRVNENVSVDLDAGTSRACVNSDIPGEYSPCLSPTSNAHTTWEDALDSTRFEGREAKGGTLKANINDGPKYSEDTTYTKQKSSVTSNDQHDQHRSLNGQLERQDSSSSRDQLGIQHSIEGSVPGDAALTTSAYLSAGAETSFFSPDDEGASSSSGIAVVNPLPHLNLPTPDQDNSNRCCTIHNF